MIARPGHYGNIEESRRVTWYAWISWIRTLAEPQAAVIHCRTIHKGPSVSEALQQVAHDGIDAERAADTGNPSWIPRSVRLRFSTPNSSKRTDSARRVRASGVPYAAGHPEKRTYGPASAVTDGTRSRREESAHPASGSGP